MSDAGDQKEQHLRKHGAFYTDANAVADPLFDQSEFFDPRDLVLVKYEMLRRVQGDGISVVQAAKRFGFSRAGFYKTLSAFQRLGLVGLIAARPGPRQAHKLTDAVLGFIDEQLAERGPLPAAELAALIFQEREVCVHPRSIERALATQKKGAVKQVLDSGTSREAWSARYEQLRAGWFVHELTWGQALFVRQGMAAWMKAWPAAEPSESATRPDSVIPEWDSSQPVAMGGELQRQLARELANLILHHRQEVLA